MVGSIDPRCETIRGAHWPRQVVWLLGTRVAEAILASGQNRPHQQAGHMDASDPIKPQNLLCHGGRPHMGPGVRPRACTHLVRLIDSGLVRGIPESVIRVICIATLRLLAEVSVCLRKLTGH